MDNMEYIKRLEERIEKLEKVISVIQSGKTKSITFTDCQIYSVAVAKSKETVVKDCSAENMVNMSYKLNMVNGKINEFKNQSGKVKFSKNNDK